MSQQTLHATFHNIYYSLEKAHLLISTKNDVNITRKVFFFF